MAKAPTASGAGSAEPARRLTLDQRVEAEIRATVREGARRLKRLGLVLPTESRPVPKKKRAAAR
jgi:hypothetical protein